MKKLLITILLLFSINAFGQVYFSGTRSTPTYNARAQEFFDRVDNAGYVLSDIQKQWYNDSIFVMLQDSGLIGTTRAGDSIQALWGYAQFMADTNILKMNLLSDSNTCVSVGTLTWTDSGYAGNGTDSYMNTNCVNGWDSTITKIYSRGFGFMSLTSRAVSTTKYMGASSGTGTAHSIYPFRALTGAAVYYVFVNVAALSVNDTNSIGFYYGGWNLGDIIYNYKRGATSINNLLQTAPNFIPTATHSYPYFFNAYNRSGTALGFDALCIPYGFITSGLSSDKVGKLANILNQALKGRGYNIW